MLQRVSMCDSRRGHAPDTWMSTNESPAALLETLKYNNSLRDSPTFMYIQTNFSYSLPSKCYHFMPCSVGQPPVIVGQPDCNQI